MNIMAITCVNLKINETKANIKMDNTPISKSILKKIRPLRKKGLSFRKIATQLDIGETTVRKYQNYIHPRPPRNRFNEGKYKFTDRQVQIAIIAAENLEKGKID
jgi:hypothetical protein